MRFWLFGRLIGTKRRLLTPDPECAIFQYNLHRIQANCNALMAHATLPEVVLRLRTFNPGWNGKALYKTFKTQPSVSGQDSFTTDWIVEPDAEIIPKLLHRLLNSLSTSPSNADANVRGRILLAEVDASLLDGASEAESMGLIDIWDLPPIDTWFHILAAPSAYFVCAWIPGELVALADAGVQVNATDNLAWLDERFPDRYASLMKR